MRTFDWLEQYLEGADVACPFSPRIVGGGGHAAKLFVILEGGIGVIAKVVDPGVPESERQAHREVAAYRLLGLLGWADLAPVTVFRELVDPTSGSSVRAAVQVMWPDNEPAAPVGAFSPDSVLRAAVFDSLMQHEDRGSQNWLGVPTGAVPQRLVLIDNGNSLRGAAVNSAFVNACRGQLLTEAVMASLEVLVSLFKSGRANRLADHLTQAEQDIVLAQAERLMADCQIS